MLVSFSFLILLTAHALPWTYGSRARIFRNPSKLCSFLSAIVLVPYLAILIGGYRSPVLTMVGTSEVDRLLPLFMLAYSAGLLALYLGIYVGRFITSRSKNTSPAVDPNYILLGIYTSLAIFSLAVFLKIEASGGLLFLSNNLALRAQLFAGTGYLDLLIQPSAFMCIFFMFYLRGKEGRPSLWQSFAIIAIIFMMLSLFGGRKLPIFTIIFAIAAYNIYVRETRLFSISTIMIGSFLFVFFIAMLQIRESFDFSIETPARVLLLTVNNASYGDTYLFIMQYFSENEFWYGRSFVDLFIRSGLIPSQGIRPPIDDGTYVRSLFQGWNVRPPVSYENLFQSSLPPESFGNGFMNFGFPGVIFFFFVRGLVVGGVFSICQHANYYPTWYFLFLFAAFNFHLTNLRIVQFLTIAAGVFFLQFLFRKTRRTSARVTR